MSIAKKESRKTRNAVLEGDTQSIPIDSSGVANPAQVDVKLSIVARQITVQPPSGVTITVTVSANGKDFLTGGTATNTAPFSYSTPHLVGVVRLLATVGAGNVSVLAV